MTIMNNGQSVLHLIIKEKAFPFSNDFFLLSGPAVLPIRTHDVRELKMTSQKEAN